MDLKVEEYLFIYQISTALIQIQNADTRIWRGFIYVAPKNQSKLLFIHSFSQTHLPPILLCFLLLLFCSLCLSAPSSPPVTSSLRFHSAWKTPKHSSLSFVHLLWSHPVSASFHFPIWFCCKGWSMLFWVTLKIQSRICWFCLLGFGSFLGFKGFGV